MRTLTLGVLIVTGGTLAALPFRRDSVAPDTSAAPTQATGPLESILDVPPVQGLVARQIDSEVLVEDKVASIMPPDYRGRRQGPVASHPISRRPSRIDSPLTFEDLTTPIERPESTKERLGAIAVISEEKRDQDRLAAMDVAPITMPSESSTFEPPRERFVTMQPTLDRQPDRAAGTLASVRPTIETQPTVTSSDQPTRFQPRSVEALPKPAPEAVPSRHWIVQP